MYETYYEIYDKMLEEIQQLRLDATSFFKLTSRNKSIIKSLKRRRKRYEEKMLKKPLEKYMKKILRYHFSIVKYLNETQKATEQFKKAINKIESKLEEYMGGTELAIERIVPEASTLNSTVKVGIMADRSKLYCKCNQPAYGNMIQCDSHTCRTKWFHYECVGITFQPKHTWHCNSCKRKKTIF